MIEQRTTSDPRERRMLTLRMPAGLHGQLAGAAKHFDLSMNQMCLDLLRSALERGERPRSSGGATQ